MKKFLIEAFENHDSPVGRWVNAILVVLIIFSIGVFIFETTETGTLYRKYTYMIDFSIMSIFTLEYLIRLYIAPRKIEFIASPLAVVDFIILIVFYFSLFNFTFLRSLRVLKILQLIKFFRYSDTLSDFITSFKNYTNELKIFFFTFIVVLLLGSSGFYYLEKDYNAQVQTIPDAIWWAIVTISTVGYGDIAPVTIFGKILSAIVMIMGLGVIAIFTAIITKMFIDHFFGKKYHNCFFCHYPRHDFDSKFCKNCGGVLDQEKTK